VVENVKKYENSDFPLSIIELCCKVVLINNFQQLSCSSKCLEENREKCFEINANLHFLERLKFTPCYGAMFQALYFRKGCINLHVCLIPNATAVPLVLASPKAYLFEITTL